MVIRNDELVGLLEKAKIEVPPFVGPKLLSCIVTIHKDADAPQSSSSFSKADTIVDERTPSKKKKENSEKKSNDSTKSSRSAKKTKATEVQPKDTIEKIGGLEVIRVLNGETQKKCVEPVKNSVEITPVIVPSEKISKVVPLASTSATMMKDTNEKKVVSKSPKVTKRKNEIENDKQSKKIQRKSDKPKTEKKSKESKAKKSENVVEQAMPVIAGELECDKIDKVVEKVAPVSSDKTALQSSNSILSVSIDATAHDIGTAEPLELSSDLLTNLQMNSNEMNASSLSPTAAFLQSFPVVSNSMPKSSEIDSSLSNPQNDHSLFENISSLFGTETSPMPKSNQPNVDCNDMICLDQANDKDKNVEMKHSVETKVIRTNLQPEKNSSEINSTKTNYRQTEFPFPFVPSSACESNTPIVPISTSTPSSATVQCNNPFDFYESLSSIGVSGTKSCSTEKKFTSPVTTKSTSYAITNLTDSKKPNDINYAATPMYSSELASAPTIQNSLTNHSTTTHEMRQIATNNSSGSSKRTPIKHSISERFIGNSKTTPSTASNSIDFNHPYSYSGLSASTTTPISFPFYHAPPPPSITCASGSSTQQFSLPIVSTSTFSSPSMSSQIEQTTGNSSLFDCFATLEVPQEKKNFSISNIQSSPATAKSIRLNDQSKPTADEKKSNDQKVEKSKANGSKTHVNWMTSTASSMQTKATPSHNYEPMHSSHFSQHYSMAAVDDNLPWSPNRILDTSNFVPTTVLPNLHGDLALNTINSMMRSDCMTSQNNHNQLSQQQQQPPQQTTHHQSHRSKQLDINLSTNCNEKSPAKKQFVMTSNQFLPQPTSYQQMENVVTNNSNSFFSVSQLVEQEQRCGANLVVGTTKKTKTNDFISSGKTIKYSSKSTSNALSSDAPSQSNVYNYSYLPHSNATGGNNASSSNMKNHSHSNNYSAEALISSPVTNQRNSFGDTSRSSKAMSLFPQTNELYSMPDYSSALPNDVYSSYYHPAAPLPPTSSSSSTQATQPCDNNYYGSTVSYPSNSNLPMAQLSSHAPPTQIQNFPQAHNSNNFATNEVQTRNCNVTPFSSSLSTAKSSTNGTVDERKIPPFTLPTFTTDGTVYKRQSTAAVSSTQKSSFNSQAPSSNGQCNKFDFRSMHPVSQTPTLPLITTSILSNNFNNSGIYRTPFYSSVNPVSTSKSALTENSAKSMTNFNATNNGSMSNLTTSTSHATNSVCNGSASNAITNFNLSTICPEIGHDKRRQTHANW